MIRIISDSSTLYSVEKAKEAGFDVSPLMVTIGGDSYKEFEEINSEKFLDLINQGNIPTSSQPAIGDVINTYESYPDDDILNICMADGLSGTYNSAVSAAQICENTERITVINSRTLCGPHKFMVENAVEMVKSGEALDKIVEKTHKLMDTARSYLIPADFAYLRRGGRLSPVVSYVGQVAKFAPIMTQTEDGTRLIALGVKRNFNHAIKHVAEILERKCEGSGWRVYVSHAGVKEKAEKAKEIIKEKMPNALIEILELSPAFITQGGPGCIAVQVINTGV